MTRNNPERARQQYYERLRPNDLAPLWEVMSSLVTPEPASACRPAIWHYERIRGQVHEAGNLITAKEAERRVLILENPGLVGQSRITTSLYAGLQLILPGEVAPAHRHTQSALRFVVEGNGAYTAVEGEKTLMHEGDFVITPSWAWHDHGNDSDEPMVWLDGLDIPIMALFDASFAQPLGEDVQPLSRPLGDSNARYGAGLLPVDVEQRATSPVFSYPYARTREALASLSRNSDWDACHGVRMKYVNPTTGGYAIPTMATFMQLLPAGFSGDTYRSTDATVFSVVEGAGHIELPEETFRWSKRDTFVVPSWCPYRLVAEEESTLFSFSDRAVQEKLGFWREAREAEG